MAIKGSLKEASLADVCQLLAMGQKTGCLSITDKSRFGQIFFDDGRIAYARIVNRRDRLGDLLVAEGLVTHEQLDEAVDQQSREPERRLGELLIENDFITREQLETNLRRQIEEAVYYLFTWSSGNFYFDANQQPEAGEVLVSINPESLLLEGARRVDEWSVIEQKIPSLDLLFEVDRERVESAEVELSQEQTRIVPLLDGGRSVKELADETGLVEFDVGQALYGLIQAGFARCTGRREPTEGKKARDAEVTEHRNLAIAFYQADLLEDATRETQRVLELRPGDATARFYLALCALRQGRCEEAVGRLKGLLEELGPRYGAFLNLAAALERMGRTTDALLVLGEIDSLRPAAPEIPLLRGIVRLKDGDTAAAREELEVYRERVGSGPPGAAYYHFTALAAALAGESQRAQSIVEAGLEQHAGSAPLLLLAGALAERRGDLTDAEQWYRQAAEEDPSLPQVHRNLGDVAYQQGMHEDAEAHFERAVQLAPELGDEVYTKLGNIRYKQRDQDEAVRYWRRALELNPDNQVAHNNVEVVAHAQG